jgi:hypothetical protein
VSSVASAAWAIWRDAQFDWVELVSAHHDQQEDRREDLESVIFLEVIVRKTIDEALRIGRAHTVLGMVSKLAIMGGNQLPRTKSKRM